MEIPIRSPGVPGLRYRDRPETSIDGRSLPTPTPSERLARYLGRERGLAPLRNVSRTEAHTPEPKQHSAAEVQLGGACPRKKGTGSAGGE